MQNYKFLNYIVLWNVFFAIICIPTAGKLIDVMGIPISISIYYFPFVYIFADIMTEVYGYEVLAEGREGRGRASPRSPAGRPASDGVERRPDGRPAHSFGEMLVECQGPIVREKMAFPAIRRFAM